MKKTSNSQAIQNNSSDDVFSLGTTGGLLSLLLATAPNLLALVLDITVAVA